MSTVIYQDSAGNHEVQLLWCPLCQDDMEKELDKFIACKPDDLDEEKANGTWGVQCGCCGLTLAGHPTPESAVNRWNGREAGRGWK